MEHRPPFVEFLNLRTEPDLGAQIMAAVMLILTLVVMRMGMLTIMGMTMVLVKMRRE